MIAGTSVTDWLSATAGTLHRESYLFVRGAEEVRVGQWSAAVAVVGHALIVLRRARAVFSAEGFRHVPLGAPEDDSRPSGHSWSGRA